MTVARRSTEGWKHLGEVVRLQVQTGVMTGKGEYDTSMLLDVEAVRATPDGVLGLLDGEWIVDRHHRDHPDAKRWHAEDVLSFGFSSHYEPMAKLVGPVTLGMAGENVIVDAEGIIEPGQIGSVRVTGRGYEAEFEGAAPMTPCVEFTRFITARPEASAREVKSDREQLRNGVRGYAMGVPAGGEATIRRGDRVWIRRVPL